MRKNIVIILVIAVLAGAGFCGWYYWWTTHATFEYSLQPVVILEGQPVKPEGFLKPGENDERISAVFMNPTFEPSSGKQDVPLTLSMGWRSVEADAPLYVLTAVDRVEHEFGETAPELKADDFLANASVAEGQTVDVRFIEKPMLLEDYPVGDYVLSLALNDAVFEVLLTVADTTPPEAEAVDIDIMIGEEVEPESFVTNITDASDDLPITITYYENEPDVFGQNQTVAVKVEDYYGNYTVVFAELLVKHNTDDPVIEGTGTIHILVGDTILYLQDVTAYDDFGRDITDRVVVDNTDVDPYTVGVYTVRYKVTDFSGRTDEVEEKVYVLEIDVNKVNEDVDKALEEIINDGMTQLQKVHAIFNWVREEIGYALNRDRPETAYEGAHIALRDRRGNCYIFYSISEVMLTRAGIENMMIERIEGTPTRHRWNLINPDGLGWHHYDSYPYPQRLNLGERRAFFTDSQARGFSRDFVEFNGTQDFYTYDTSLYPPIIQ